VATSEARKTMSRYGRVKKIGPGHYRIVHSDGVRGQAQAGNECAHCGKPRTRRARGQLCSKCRRVESVRREYGERR